ncbi:HD domain-containing phosphohydrolase [Nostocoides sp. Soil756]|uniref:HD-GYP domain-containing protein n=1 Tax=Nostocoides sp. Soil756 TaxID=1736399 RepID=UPI0012FCA083|nr:HD domain-containing phosphohydrolase [Tetrasphaera sp. Soil756]
MRAALRVARPLAAAVTLVAAGLVVTSLVLSGAELPTLLGTHAVTLVVFLGSIVIGELVRLRMPSGRDTAPLASASALALAVVGPIQDQPVFQVGPGLVVLVVAMGLALAAGARRLRHLPVSVAPLAARLLGVALTASMVRQWSVAGWSLWEDQTRSDIPRGVVAVGMALAAAVGLVVELLLVATVRAERQRTPWTTATRDELGEAAPLTFAVAVTGPMVALMSPILGLLALPVALVPLVMAYSAVGQYARNRATNRQLIATLSRLTEEGGYTPSRHAERVSDLSVRVGRVLGLGERELRDIEYAALLHDLGQISLTDPIPDGATVLAAPSDQRDIAAEGARIIRRAESLDAVARYVELQTTPYRRVRELGEEVPMGSRIIKCTNAFDDLTGGSDEPAAVEAAIERIHLGLGYEYDPDVVDALTRVVEDATAGRVGERRLVSR